MAPTKIMLLACGSFNPPTNMHLRMFEIARDTLNRQDQNLVVGGIISPVHDSYGKKDLVPASNRCDMLKLALQSSDWIKLSSWECSQESWTNTRQVLKYHQDLLNSIITEEKNKAQNIDLINANIDGFNGDSWITNDIRNSSDPINVTLLCGADFLQSFGIPGLWSETDIESIIQHYGIVVISRQGYDPYRFIYESDILTKHQSNILVINEWVTNEVSSTKIRRALRRKESVKYLIQDSVIQYIQKCGLYGCKENEFKYSHKININEGLTIPCLGDVMLTPSPSDVNMKSVNKSGENIYLELSKLDSPKEVEVKTGKSKTKMENSEQSQLSEEITMAKGSGMETEVRENLTDNCIGCLGNPEEAKKVGFTDGSDIDIIERSLKGMPNCGNINREKEKSRTSDELNFSGSKTTSKLFQDPKETSKNSIKASEQRKISKIESEGNVKRSSKSNIFLRRSNSDAVMSRRDENGDVVSVKIQFTKDGVKVISDKESMV